MVEYLKEWKDVNKTCNKVVMVFAKWQKKNLKIVHGDYEHKNTVLQTMAYTYGLPYTSSGMYAELACTNVQAVKWNRLLAQYMNFRCLRLDEEGNVYAIFCLSDSVTEMYEVIGNIQQ